MPSILTESNIEDVALEILSELGYKILHGPDIAPDGINPQRKSYSDVVLVKRLRDAVDRINPNIPREAREEAIKKVLRTQSSQLIINNQNFQLRHCRRCSFFSLDRFPGHEPLFVGGYCSCPCFYSIADD